MITECGHDDHEVQATMITMTATLRSRGHIDKVDFVCFVAIP
jgi:hypothetical protein